MAAILSVMAYLSLTACSTGLHAGFVAHTYIAANMEKRGQARGRVSGASCQTRALYLFPQGPAPSTEKAVDMAMSQYEGTEYLANMAVEDRTEWGFLYLRQCIVVTGTAY